MDQSSITLRNEKEIRTVLNPYSIRILQIYRDHKEPLTVKQVATIMDEVHGKVYYYVKKLFDLGLLYITKTEVLKGITLKYYKRTYDIVYYSMDNIDIMRDFHNSALPYVFDSCMKGFQYDLQSSLQRFDLPNQEMKYDPTITKEYVYLSKEEYEEVNNMIDEYMLAHRDKKPHKELFAFLYGNVRLE